MEFCSYFEISFVKFYRTFKLKPTHGILKDFQLVVFEMIPRDAKLYNSIIKYQLNSTASVYFKVEVVLIVNYKSFFFSL